MAIVYVLSNPAFDRYVKVGRTSDLEQRVRQLDNTSVPLPFRCEFAIEVDDEVEAERLVHQAFADVHVRSSREFFEIEPQRVIAALKLTGGKDVTPKEDVAEDAEGIEALSENDSALDVMGDTKLKLIAHELLQSVRSNATIDWHHSEMARAKIRVAVKRILKKYGYPPDLQSAAIQTVLQQAEAFSEKWAA